MGAPLRPTALTASAGAATAAARMLPRRDWNELLGVGWNRSLAGALSRTATRTGKLREGLSEDRSGCSQEENCDAHAYDEVGPKRSRPCDQNGRNENRCVRDQVVARAQPRGPEVDVVTTMPPEKKKAERIGEQGKRADHRHYGNQRRLTGTNAKGRLDKNADAENSHDKTLAQSGASAPYQAALENEEAEQVDERVTKHVQRVGKERGGPREETGSEGRYLSFAG